MAVTLPVAGRGRQPEGPASGEWRVLEAPRSAWAGRFDRFPDACHPWRGHCCCGRHRPRVGHLAAGEYVAGPVPAHSNPLRRFW